MREGQDALLEQTTICAGYATIIGCIIGTIAEAICERMGWRHSHIEHRYMAGVLGLALLGKYGDPDVAWKDLQKELKSCNGNTVAAASRLLGVSEQLASSLHVAQTIYGMDAYSIAYGLQKWL